MKKVTVLMSTYNGEKYLDKQIQSLLLQKDINVQIFVRDDGSSDDTKVILNRYKEDGVLEWYQGENLKPAGSFMDLISKAPKSDYYAFCDQDDYWLDDKLEIALKYLSKCPIEIPALYYGCPRLVDKDLSPLKLPNTSKDRMLDFRSSLIESNATGCTMVFNYALITIIRQKYPNYISMHDRWIHKVCIAVKGKVYFDEDVHILYRQHGSNVMGISKSKIKKMKKKLINTDCNRSKSIKLLVSCYGEFLTKEEKYLADLIINYQNGLIPKIKLLMCKNIRTDYFSRNVMFRLMVLFGSF